MRIKGGTHSRRINLGSPPQYMNYLIYAWVDDNMPDWAKPTVTKLMRKGYLKGDGEGKLMLDDNMLRILVINDRAGIYGE